MKYGAVEMTAINISISWPDNNDTRNRRGLTTFADSSTWPIPRELDATLTEARGRSLGS